MILGLLMAALALGLALFSGTVSPAFPPPQGVAFMICGHDDLYREQDGGLTPLFIAHSDRPTQASICLQTPSESLSDLHAWTARVHFGSPPSRWRLWNGPTIEIPGGEPFEGVKRYRFPLPDRLLGEDPVQVCVDIVDGFARRVFRLPCRRLRFEDRPERARLAQEIKDWWATLGDQVLNDWIEEGLQLSGKATRSESPFLAFRAWIIVMTELWNRNEFERAASLSQEPFPWMSEEAATRQKGHFHLQRGLIRMELGDLGASLEDLQQASSLLHRILDRQLAWVDIQLANLLLRNGAPDEALKRLDLLLEHRERFTRHLPVIYDMRAWVMALKTDAPQQALLEARNDAGGYLAELGRQAGRQEKKDKANSLINLAYLDFRLGKDPLPTLSEARSLLSFEGASAAPISGHLPVWADLLEGLHHLESSRPDQALQLCRSVEADEYPRLAAWRLSCVGRAQAALGRFDQASRTFRQAIYVQEHLAASNNRLRIPLGPSHRAETYYRAARVELRRGNGRGAWELLSQLDSATMSEQDRRRCRDAARGEQSRKWRLLEEEISQLVEQMARLPLTAPRERLERLHRRLQDRVRQTPNCASPRRGNRPWSGYRAVLVDDDILLLHRSELGRVERVRETTVGRWKLIAIRDSLRRFLEQRDVPTREWRALLRPLARALMPDRGDESEIVAYGLHGLLQEIPLASLPLPEEGRDGRRWFFESFTPVLQPALSASGHCRPSTASLDRPSTASLDRPSTASLDRPSAASLDRPSTASLDRPSAASLDRPSAASLDRPSAASLDRPSASGSGPTSDTTSAGPPPALFAGRSSTSWSGLFIVDPLGDLSRARGLVGEYRRLFSGSVILVGEKASLDNLSLRLPQARFLHLDTHGVYQESQPEASYLALADQRLILVRAADLPAPWEFVNLSGCQTGRWPVTADSGQYGFGGAFARAGTPWVIATRADLPEDLAADFSRAFYGALASGKSVAVAYSEALGRVSQDYSPAAWASLMLIRGAAAPQR